MTPKNWHWDLNLSPDAINVILTNDPYGAHCPHLPDWGFIRPIFYKGRLLFFTMVRGHQEDTGGAFPGGYFANGYDIHAEGIRIPVVYHDKRRRLIHIDVGYGADGIGIDNVAILPGSCC